MNTTYTKINQEHINSLKLIIDADDILTDQENLEKYGRDETEDLVFKPEIIVRPKNVSQI